MVMPSLGTSCSLVMSMSSLGGSRPTVFVTRDKQGGGEGGGDKGKRRVRMMVEMKDEVDGGCDSVSLKSFGLML